MHHSEYEIDQDSTYCSRYQQKIFVPEFLFAEIEQQVITQLLQTIKIPAEDADNKQNVNR